MSVQSNLEFFQGEDIFLTLVLTPPQDITGWTLQGTVRNALGGTVQFSYAGVVSDAGRGTFTITWGRSNTSTLAPGDYVWDVRRTDSGKNTVLAHGQITVKQPVTP